MNGDLNMLIQTHSGLVYSQLHKFNLIHDPDAESFAFEALYNAIVNFDESKGTKLSTVATVYIYNALGSYVRSLKSSRQLKTISYNNIAYSDDNDEHEFVDLLPSGSDIESDYILKEEHRYVMLAFNMLYDKLTNEKHKVILQVWKDSEFTAQTRKIASQVGVSQSYVSQVINNFKFSLKKKMEEIYYD